MRRFVAASLQQSGVSSGSDIVVERVYAPGVSVAAWARSLSMWVRAGEPGRVLKRDGPHVVVASGMFGRGVVVKRWRPSAWTRFRSGISGSKSERHWRGAAWLTRHGIDTASCLAMAHDASIIARCDYLIMEELTGPTVLDVLTRARQRDVGGAGEMGHAGGDVRAEDAAHGGTSAAAAGAGRRAVGVREELAIAREVGRQIASMIAHGRFNRDHKPSNLIVVWRGGRAGVAVIDCVAILPLWRGGGAGGSLERMLASLCIEPLGVGVVPRRALVMATLCAALGVERGGGRGGRGAMGLSPSAKLALRGVWRTVAARVRAQGGPARG